MNLEQLYKFSQNIMRERVERKENSVAIPVIDLVEELKTKIKWIEDINIRPVPCREGDPHGHYELHGNRQSRWDDDDAWVVLITYDRVYKDNDNLCYRRYVWSKELMHVFDTTDGQISDGDRFRTLLDEIEYEPPKDTRSEAYWAENSAYWKALLVLCPKVYRDEIKAKWDANELTDYEVALHFRIPEELVKSLFSAAYDLAYNAYLK